MLSWLGGDADLHAQSGAPNLDPISRQSDLALGDNALDMTRNCIKCGGSDAGLPGLPSPVGESTYHQTELRRPIGGPPDVAVLLARVSVVMTSRSSPPRASRSPSAQVAWYQVTCADQIEQDRHELGLRGIDLIAIDCSATPRASEEVGHLLMLFQRRA